MAVRRVGSRASFQRSNASWLLLSGLALGMLLSVSGFSVIVCKLGVIMLPTP